MNNGLKISPLLNPTPNNMKVYFFILVICISKKYLVNASLKPLSYTYTTLVLTDICNKITVQSNKIIPPTKCLVILIGNLLLTLIE